MIDGIPVTGPSLFLPKGHCWYDEVEGQNVPTFDVFSVKKHEASSNTDIKYKTSGGVRSRSATHASCQ